MLLDLNTLHHATESLQALILWADITSQDNKFCIIDHTDPIFKSVQRCYNEFGANTLLQRYGVVIVIEDIDQVRNPIYRITFNK